MKKLLVILTIAIPMCWNCTTGPNRADLHKMNDSLYLASIQKDIQLNQLIETIGDIEENLRIIKEKEKIVSLKAEKGDYEGISKEQINEDINLIYELMLENKNKIEELEKQLKNAGVERGRLNKLVESLTRELKEKGEEIVRLNEMLIVKNEQIVKLNVTVSDLTGSLASLSEKNRQTQAELEATKDLQNTAYYAIGTKKELKDRKITDRNGFLFFGEKKVLPDGFDKQYFQIIDIRNTKSISISGKKPKLLTRHPNNSYEIVNEDKGNSTLNILDTEMFWSINKYLVVQVN